MKITFAGVVLADASIGLPPLDMRLNGTRVVELADFARAATKGVFWRGNASNTFSFTVSREFGSYADAQDAYFLAESQAPVSGPLSIIQTAAAANRPPLSMVGVLATVAPSLLGVRVDTAYTIQGGRFLGGSLAVYQADTDSPTTMFGSIALPAGADHVAVPFPAPLPSPVVSGLTIVAPTGADSPSVWKVEQITQDGFVAYFTGSLPAAGYTLHWQAKQGAAQ